jgi:hypothetical protein
MVTFNFKLLSAYLAGHLRVAEHHIACKPRRASARPRQGTGDAMGVTSHSSKMSWTFRSCIAFHGNDELSLSRHVGMYCGIETWPGLAQGLLSHYAAVLLSAKPNRKWLSVSKDRQCASSVLDLGGLRCTATESCWESPPPGPRSRTPPGLRHNTALRPPSSSMIFLDKQSEQNE